MQRQEGWRRRRRRKGCFAIALHRSWWCKHSWLEKRCKKLISRWRGRDKKKLQYVVKWHLLLSDNKLDGSLKLCYILGIFWSKVFLGGFAMLLCACGLYAQKISLSSSAPNKAKADCPFSHHPPRNCPAHLRNVKWKIRQERRRFLGIIRFYEKGWMAGGRGGEKTPLKKWVKRGGGGTKNFTRSNW